MRGIKIAEDPIQFLLNSMVLHRLMLSENHIYRKIIISLYTFLQVFLILITTTLVSIKGFRASIAYLPTIIAQQYAIFSMLMVIFYSKNIDDYQKTLMTICFDAAKCTKRGKARIAREVLKIKIFTAFILTYTISRNFLYTPFVGDEEKFIIYQVMIKKYADNAIVFVAVYFIYLPFCGYLSVSSYVYMTYVMISMKIQLTCLEDYLRNKVKQVMPYEREYHSRIFNHLKNCVRYTSNLDSALTKLGGGFGVPILIVAFIVLLMVVSHLSFIIIKVSPPSNFRMVLALANFVIIFTFSCIHGQLVSDESNLFYETLYKCNWYNWSVKNQKVLLLMLRNGRYPKKISSFELVVTNNELILKGVQLVYSLVAVAANVK